MENPYCSITNRTKFKLCEILLTIQAYVSPFCFNLKNINAMSLFCWNMWARRQLLGTISFNETGFFSLMHKFSKINVCNCFRRSYYSGYVHTHVIGM